MLKAVVDGMTEISIHAPRAGSDKMVAPLWAADKISIHAPRAGSDVDKQVLRRVIKGISIHAPRAGSDSQLSGVTSLVMISIHAPRAGSDFYRGLVNASDFNFNPRSPCGERQ